MVNGLTIPHYKLLVFLSLLGMHPLFAAPEKHHQLHDAHAQSTALNKSTFLDKLKPVMTFIAGASMSKLGASRTIQPVDLCQYSYSPNHSDKAHMLWGGFIGSEIKRTPTWALVAGLSYYQPTSLGVRGLLAQGADEESADNYNYRYHVQSQQLLAEGKWYWTAREKFLPFVLLGIGAAFNKVSDYQTNVPSFTAFTPTFSNHSQTNFTYALGAGFDVPLTNLFRLGFGYRFTDLGSANTGTAQLDGTPTTSTLQQSHVYANQVFAQITFIPSLN